jgi:hypothetical protein
MRKLGAHNSADLTREAFRMGLIRNMNSPLTDQPPPSA